jgi:membrane dipeptidase
MKEGGDAIEDDLRLLRRFYDEGIRYMTLTHSNSNHWADSSGDTNKPNNGLTPFGKDVVREMNRLGMIVDISHVADKTFRGALETSKAPIFASHSRNMTDDMIAALGRKGGVVQINFDCGYLNQEAATAAEAAQMASLRPVIADIQAKYADDTEGMMKAFREARGPADPRVHATLADVVRHVTARGIQPGGHYQDLRREQIAADV